MTEKSLSPRREHFLLLTLAGIQVTHILDFMVMMPLGPQLIPLFGITDAQFGWLVSAYTLAAGASGLFAMTYIDRFDRKPLLVVLYSLFGLATLACAFAPTYGVLASTRIAAGLFGGVLTALVQTIVAEAIPFERRGRAMGVVMTSFSVATVAGVPSALYVASIWGWHAPFFMIGSLTLLFALGAWLTLPLLRGSARAHDGVFKHIAMVLKDSNHQNSLAMSACMMFAGFTVIPFLTIYWQANVGLTTAQVPLIYLCGGVATLFTARWIGRTADRLGKLRVFRIMAIAALFPMFATTLMPPVPLWMALSVSTLFFVFANGRMIPGAALASGAADPRYRGAFMSLNSAVQSAAMGVAAFVGGHVISRDPAGHVLNYWQCALLGVLGTAGAIWFAGRLKIHDAGR